MFDNIRDEPRWQRSRRCGESNCVEVARTELGFAIRDSKDPRNGALHLSPVQWAGFIDSVRAGEYDADARLIP